MNRLPTGFASSVIEQACAIQAIPAPTFDEGRRAEYFVQQFCALGLQDVHIDGAGNVLGRLPGYGTARPLLVSAHMDTVHPLEVQHAVLQMQDRMVGPGIGDNALGLAALCGLARLLIQHKTRLPGDLWLVANVAEEGLGDLRGMQALVDHFQDRPIAYLVLEGMGLGTILHRGLGVERYRISVQTPGGHSWVDFGKPSAVHELAGIVTRLAGLALPRTPMTTLNVGVMHGGTSVNTIAAQAWLELDLRSEDSLSLQKLRKQVKSIIDLAQRPDVMVRMEQIGRRIPGQIAPSHPLVQLCAAVLEDLHIPPRLEIASTDANLPLSRGYPAVCIGISSGQHAHTTDEYILLEPVPQGMLQVYNLVTRAWEALQ